jgi:hypothetical protein
MSASLAEIDLAHRQTSNAARVSTEKKKDALPAETGPYQ